MTSSIYVALSAQMALQRRMETVANNVANLNTSGFRAEEVRFETVLSKMGAREVSYSDSGQSYISRRSGSVTPTGNPLDVAITGDAWFGVSTPDGVAYTRDGRLQMTEAGDLVSVDGKPILDGGGAPDRARSDRRPGPHRRRRIDRPERPAGRRARALQPARDDAARALRRHRRDVERGRRADRGSRRPGRPPGLPGRRQRRSDHGDDEAHHHLAHLRQRRLRDPRRRGRADAGRPHPGARRDRAGPPSGGTPR